MNNIDIRCLPAPNSPQFVNCPHKVTTAAWYLQNDGVIDDYDKEGNWKEYLRSILEDDIWVNKNNPDKELRTYSDEDIDEIINILDEENKYYEEQEELEELKEKYPGLAETDIDLKELKIKALHFLKPETEYVNPECITEGEVDDFLIHRDDDENC